MSVATVKFSVILWGLAQALRLAAWRHPVFRARLKERNFVAQLKARDEETGRWFERDRDPKGSHQQKGYRFNAGGARKGVARDDDPGLLIPPRISLHHAARRTRLVTPSPRPAASAATRALAM